jgi:hypothetical protein
LFQVRHPRCRRLHLPSQVRYLRAQALQLSFLLQALRLAPGQSLA